MSKETMKQEINEALEKNNTTAGRLSAVLGLVDKYAARIAELEAAQQGVQADVCHVCKGEKVVMVDGRLRTCTYC